MHIRRRRHVRIGESNRRQVQPTRVPNSWREKVAIAFDFHVEDVSRSKIVLNLATATTMWND